MAGHVGIIAAAGVGCNNTSRPTLCVYAAMEQPGSPEHLHHRMTRATKRLQASAELLHLAQEALMRAQGRLHAARLHLAEHTAPEPLNEFLNDDPMQAEDTPT